MNSRSAQILAAALAFLLIVLIGALIFVLLSRPGPTRPTPAPSGSGVAVASPSPSSALPSPTLPSFAPSDAPSAGPSELPSPSLLPSPEPSPTISPSPTPSPTPVPTVNPTTTQREIRFIRVGLDSRLEDTWVERIVTFTVEGQSLIEARTSAASAGGVRMCLWREALDDQRECRSGRNMAISRAVLDAGFTTWHVSLVGPREQISPFVDLTLRFNASEPRVELDNFRYVGTTFAEYNGFLAQFAVASRGGMRVEAEFEDGQNGEYPNHLIIGPVGGAATYDQDSSPNVSSGFSVIHPIGGRGDWRVELRNPDELAADGLLAVFVRAILTWP